jgi:hypothetical protein
VIGQDFMTEPLSLSGWLDQNPFVDPRTGNLTQFGVMILERFRLFVSGMSRVIPCDATGTDVILLTPAESAPRIQRYNSYDIFVARAEADSTAAVTASVVPDQGELPTRPVYMADGTTQAAAGDVQADSLYFFVFADYVNNGDGGFILK